MAAIRKGRALRRRRRAVQEVEQGVRRLYLVEGVEIGVQTPLAAVRRGFAEPIWM